MGQVGGEVEPALLAAPLEVDFEAGFVDAASYLSPAFFEREMRDVVAGQWHARVLDFDDAGRVDVAQSQLDPANFSETNDSFFTSLLRCVQKEPYTIDSNYLTYVGGSSATPPAQQAVQPAPFVSN